MLKNNLCVIVKVIVDSEDLADFNENKSISTILRKMFFGRNISEGYQPKIIWQRHNLLRIWLTKYSLSAIYFNINKFSGGILTFYFIKDTWDKEELLEELKQHFNTEKVIIADETFLN